MKLADLSKNPNPSKEELDHIAHVVVVLGVKGLLRKDHWYKGGLLLGCLTDCPACKAQVLLAEAEAREVKGKAK